MNNAYYLSNTDYYTSKKVKRSQYTPSICDSCRAKAICSESNKERRLSCLREVWDYWNRMRTTTMRKLHDENNGERMLVARCSEEIMDELVEKMNEFLKNHKISELINLVLDAIATKEDS